MGRTAIKSANGFLTVACSFPAIDEQIVLLSSLCDSPAADHLCTSTHEYSDQLIYAVTYDMF